MRGKRDKEKGRNGQRGLNVRGNNKRQIHRRRERDTEGLIERRRQTTANPSLYTHNVNSNMGLMFSQDLFSSISPLPVAGCMSGSAISQITATWDFGNTQRCNGKKSCEKKKQKC